MRRILAALLIICCAAALTAPARAQSPAVRRVPGASPPVPGPQPKLEAVNPVFDFGTALEGEMVRHVFKIRNAGKGNLVIRGVKSSCGCAAAEPTRSMLAPGEDAEIAAAFDTQHQKGHQVRTITAITNDPANPQAIFTIQGTIKQQVAATPAEIAFGKVTKGTAVTREVVISDLLGGKKFEVGNVSNTSKSIKVTEHPRPDRKPGAILKVELLPTMPVGPFEDSIKIITNRVPVNVSVFGTIQGDLSLDPAQVSFGIAPRGQDVVRILRLTNRSQRKINVLDVASTTQSVVASAEPVTPGKEYKITVVLKRGTPDGQVRGKLAIKTDDPEQATLDVPFYGVVGQFKI
ncbi:MAG: DUF1573 domain-containing protein [Candidatus Binataceae bacterium]